MATHIVKEERLTASHVEFLEDYVTHSLSHGAVGTGSNL